MIWNQCSTLRRSARIIIAKRLVAPVPGQGGEVSHAGKDFQTGNDSNPPPGALVGGIFILGQENDCFEAGGRYRHRWLRHQRKLWTQLRQTAAGSELRF